MKEVARYRECFVCGENNTCGLKARFFAQDDGSVISEYKVEKRFAGYAGVLHGGVLASLLDEVMIKAILKDDILAVTAQMEVKFLKPVYVDQVILLTGRVIENRGKLFKTLGEAVVEGEIVCTACGTYIRARGELAETLTESLE